MFKRRSFWTYSLALAVVWAIVLIVINATRGSVEEQRVLILFAGFCLGWASTTIARYIYPPPTNRLTHQRNPTRGTQRN